ncbi:MAG: response regulator, partial [Gemmatimonadota bacterium]
AVPAAQPVHTTTSNSDTTARILIVDDETGMREGCRRALTPVGYGIDTTDSTSSALNLIKDDGYDLYLLDVMLPDGSGLDRIEPILDQDPNAICIVITGYGSIEMAVEAVRRGAYTFLSKPFTSEQLLVAVAQGLEREDLAGRSIDLAGPERLSFVRIVRILGETIGRVRPILPLPEAFAATAARIAATLGVPSPFSATQFDILRYGSVLPSGDNPVRSLFQLKPLPFADAVTDYLENG